MKKKTSAVLAGLFLGVAPLVPTTAWAGVNITCHVGQDIGSGYDYEGEYLSYRGYVSCTTGAYVTSMDVEGSLQYCGTSGTSCGSFMGSATGSCGSGVSACSSFTARSYNAAAGYYRLYIYGHVYTNGNTFVNSPQCSVSGDDATCRAYGSTVYYYG